MTPDVVVVGSLNVDLTVPVERVPRSGETVLGGNRRRGPGGKGANQAVACARLGRRTALVGCVGEDDEGRLLTDRLTAEGVDAGHVGVVAAPTGLALILLADAESTIVVSPGANAELGPERVRTAADALGAARAVLCQLEVPMAAVEEAARLAGGLVVLNPAPAAPLPASLLAEVDVLVPNRPELGVLLGEPPAATLDEAVAMARRVTGPKGVVVTLGADGAVVVEDGQATHVPAVAVRAVDATAAGDSFCAALVDGLLAGRSLADATRWAVRVAAVTVTRPGAIDALPEPADVPAAR